MHRPMPTDDDKRVQFKREVGQEIDNLLYDATGQKLAFVLVVIRENIEGAQPAFVANVNPDIAEQLLIDIGNGLSDPSIRNSRKDVIEERPN